MTIQVHYPTKKALKAAVGQTLNYTETSMFEAEFKANGSFPVADGSPKRSWFAKVTMKDGKIAKVE